MHLSRFLLWRIAALSLAILLLALLLARWQAQRNIRHEALGAAQVARMLDHLGGLEAGPAADIPAHLAALRTIIRSGQLRHLRLRLSDQDGTLLLASPNPAASPWSSVYHWLLPLNTAPAQAPTRWTLQREDGPRYQVELALDPASEQRESLVGMLGLVGLLLGYSAAILLAVYGTLHLALRPLQAILAAIGGYQRDRYQARLAPMRIVELDAIGKALNHMAQSLQDAQRARAEMNRRMWQLQEDERRRLAGELHDELGQQLTAMRADATWLARCSEDRPELQHVARQVAGQCAQMQQGVRGLLQRLRPHGSPRVAGEPFPLRQRLQELLQSWRERPSQHTDYQLRIELAQAPCEDVALAIYRLTQEALTNIARHAQAASARIEVITESDGRVRWSVRDDGIGIADLASALHRGSGLAGMRERVLALHGQWQLHAGSPGDIQSGLWLQAHLPLQVSETSAFIAAGADS
ncbi:MAG: histidine kinase [Dyella sp.]